MLACEPRPSAIGLPFPIRVHITSQPTNKQHYSGPAKDDGAHQRALAVDVVVNPWVVREALKHRAFQAQVVELAFEWVGEEAGLQLSPEAPSAVLPKTLCPYWDGGGEEGGNKTGTPRPFILDKVSVG